MKTQLIKILKKILNKLLENKKESDYNLGIIGGSSAFGSVTINGNTTIGKPMIVSNPTTNETYKISDSIYNTITSFLDKILKQKHLDIEFINISEYIVQFSVDTIYSDVFNTSPSTATATTTGLLISPKKLNISVSYDKEKKLICFSFNNMNYNVYGTTTLPIYGNTMFKYDSYVYFKSLYDKCVSINSELLENRINNFLTERKQDFNMLRQEKLDELLSN